MLRVPLNKAWLKRTFRPLYGWTQMTPAASLLDPAWNRAVPIYPGMVCMKTKGDNISLIGVAPAVPHGFFAEFIGGDGIDEPLARGVNATAAWVMGPDAEAEILSPAFDTGSTWVDPADGTVVLCHAITDGTNRGKLAPAGQAGRGTLSVKPVCRLHKVDSASKIIVSGLHVGDPVDAT